MSSFLDTLESKFKELDASEKIIISEVISEKHKYIKWPSEARLLWEGCMREKYHKYPFTIKEEVKSKGIKIDARSNGPAVMSYYPMVKDQLDNQTQIGSGQFITYTIINFLGLEKEKHFTQLKTGSILLSQLDL